MEYWSIGVMEYLEEGMMECWKNGRMEEKKSLPASPFDTLRASRFRKGRRQGKARQQERRQAHVVSI